MFPLLFTSSSKEYNKKKGGMTSKMFVFRIFFIQTDVDKASIERGHKTRNNAMESTTPIKKAKMNERPQSPNKNEQTAI